MYGILFTNILGSFYGFHLGKYTRGFWPAVPHEGWPQHNPLRRSASVAGWLKPYK